LRRAVTYRYGVPKSLNRRSAGVVACLSTAAALLFTACSSSSTSGNPTTGAGSSASNGASQQASSGAPTTTAPSTPPATPVHVQGYPDGSTVGIGMPIIATFNKKITEAKDFAKDTAVTVNGKPANGAWYFEYSDPSSGHLLEAHYRPQKYWPAHAHVHVAFNLKGVSAGKGLVFDGKLSSLDFYTGAAHVAIVNDATHRMTVTSDGKTWGTFPVSLGAHDTPTKRGVKVIMEKGRDISMRGPGYFDPHVKFTQRLTYGGEYLHSAPWNVYNITHGIDSSNGCTNLLPSDATKLYQFLQIGDVVDYPNANGPEMTLGAGYGDWNVSWSQWITGGAVATS
jgi:lipoprotein-anchoring transpeptidase ErfK/SrfK